MKRLIEKDFPFEHIDPIAELESWRKEIHRPNYHIHKWWANRLGSVFRGIVIGTAFDNRSDIWKHFYEKHEHSGTVVLDPFMGSGTTLGECVKLGINPIGCDINPISTFIVKQSLTNVPVEKLEEVFKEIEIEVKGKITQYYKTVSPYTGDLCDVLYYFWVKVVTTPHGEEIPLFRHYVFSRNAYPRKKPQSRILCKYCGEINLGRYDATMLECESCGRSFNPQSGNVSGQFVVDSQGNSWKIRDLVLQSESHPEHRLYAIMALEENGKKIYIKPKKFDFDLYAKASRKLRRTSLPLPNMKVRSGYNTNQARGYNYLNWRDFFNDRQLLCLGTLLKSILSIGDTVVREHFLCLFSGTLEFNNMFCSFKGEGTGAVRHMFSHHILKPERTPLENNVWGTRRSSGAFSSLFRSRLLKAKQYLNAPFEIELTYTAKGKTSSKIICSDPIDVTVCDEYKSFIKHKKAALVLNGDSGNLPLPDRSVDAVITDPPYFDFVHYSELSDFFFAWLAPVLNDSYEYFGRENSYCHGEVQDTCHDSFSENLCRVFKECHRTLKNNGLLVFSFHHSKPTAWMAIYKSIVNAGFSLMAAHPVKAEMSVGSPKSATRNPINIDAILVCKKCRNRDTANRKVWTYAMKNAMEYEERFERINRTLTDADRSVIMASQILVHSSKAQLEFTEVHKLLERVFAPCFSS